MNSRATLASCISVLLLGSIGQSHGFVTPKIAARGGSTSLKMSTETMYERKCPFHVPKEGVKFNNLPSLKERIPIRVIHYLQRKLIQAKGFNSRNPLVKLFSTLFYLVDMFWALADNQYWVKRQAMFGPNFISSMTVSVSKFDTEAKAKDSIDGLFLSYPQRRDFFLGNTVMNKETSFFFGEKTKKHEHGKSVISLYVSDPGATPNPSLPPDQPDHSALRDIYTKAWLSEEGVNAAIARQTDETGSKILSDFAKALKEGKKERKNIVEDFMPLFICYTLFDIPVEKIDVELLNSSVCSLDFIFNLFGPNWVFKATPLGSKQKAIAEKVDKFCQFVAEEARSLKPIRDHPLGLTKDQVVAAIPMLFGIAGYVGTKGLVKTCVTQMPEDYMKKVVEGGDIEKIKDAVLECARLDTPVIGAHQIADDEEGITTEIGGKKFTFPRGTTVHTTMTIANVDADRFENPFVFDPESRDFNKLTSFNGIGNKSYDPSPRICPGRLYAVMAATNAIKALVAA